MRYKKFCSTAKTICAICAAFFCTIVSLPTQAQTFTVLHTFHGYDGAGPLGSLILDSSGNIYGTTNGGGVGAAISPCGKSGCGTAFMLNKSGKQIWQHNFNGKNGEYPFAGLYRDSAGNLYGTTVEGGANCYDMGFPGCGTVYRLDKTGKETLLYSFAGTPGGLMPEALLVGDTAGNLYGTTYLGGASGGYGTVFKLDPQGTVTILHSFAGPPDGGSDGAVVYSGVIRNGAGNIYGVTFTGGTFGGGIAYELDTADAETVLYNFPGGPDGDGPASVLIQDAAGNLYGTSQDGGNLNCGGGSGCGVVFELSPNSGGNWTESVLYAFCALSNCADGERPIAGPLVRDASGNLYGTTYFGGAYRNCNGDTCGVVYKLDTTGKETVLHSFTGGADGATPWAGLTIDGVGNLYGVAGIGGDTSCTSPQGCGVVFKITPE